MDFIKSFLRNASNKMKLLVFGIILLILTIIIVAVVHFATSRKQPEPTNVEIDNFSSSLSSADLPDYYQAQIQQYLWTKLKHLPNVDKDTVFTATIREGSIKKNDEDKYTLLVDIPDLRYTFQISFFYNPELFANNPYAEPSYYIGCPIADEIIYPETKCPIGTPIDNIKRFLPIAITTPSGHKIFTKIETYADYQEYANEQYLAVYVNSCGDKSVLPATEKAFRKQLKEYALDPNDYHIEIMDACYE